MLSESIKSNLFSLQIDELNCAITLSLVGMGKRTKIENPSEENR